MTRAKAEQLKGNTDALILAALEGEALHGYAIARKIEELTDSYLTLNEGSLYPTLHRLEQEGAVKAAWDAKNGRRRKCYRITRKGRGVLAKLRQEWREFAASIDRVLGVVASG
ncbi:MAG TPA: PadR family transcriptional regulator [Armatimonadota bacterium]|jgi:transcriptional regulator|nr:PadR family transcriptional regulator [Armatimonadota bacterium]